MRWRHWFDEVEWYIQHGLVAQHLPYLNERLESRGTPVVWYETPLGRYKKAWEAWKLPWFSTEEKRVAFAQYLVPPLAHVASHTTMPGDVVRGLNKDTRAQS